MEFPRLFRKAAQREDIQHEEVQGEALDYSRAMRAISVVRKWIKPEAAESRLAREECRWYRKGLDPADTSGRFASQRLRSPFFVPVIKPTFQVSRRDRFFAIGSCFARGIESALKGRGFQVESAARDFDQFETRDDLAITALGFTNKYTTHSILNEIKWALDPEASFPEASIIELDDGICVDPHINPTLKPVDRVRTLERHGLMTEVVRRLRDCRVVFLTPGLVEVWYDKKAGVYLNAKPPVGNSKIEKDRYQLMMTGYMENLENLESIYELLTKYGHPDLHIIVTTSPVPLMATFTDQDVVLANTYSKSTLRAVTQDWASAHPNIDYFPSYEIVMNSGREVAWLDDMRHVTGPLTNHIMKLFVKSYVR